jgi:hypothetical protein
VITSEEKQLRERLALDEITFAVPAQSFAISCAISAEETLPVVTEFALRIAYVCGDLSPVQIQEFFGFSKKETDAVVQALLGERLIQWNEDRLELTTYALARFQDSSDNLPRFFKIQDFSAEVVFDLISFHPAGRPDRLKRVRFQVELGMRNTDKQSRTIQHAEQAFQQHFRQICKKDKAEIYKISAVDAGERFSIPLPCVFHLDLDGQTSVRRDIDDESFGARLEIAEAISDALGHHGAGNNDQLRDFIRTFDDKLIERYAAQDSFDLRRYVQEVHLTQGAAYDDARVTPILGSLYLKRNAELVLGRLNSELERLAHPPEAAIEGEDPAGPEVHEGAGVTAVSEQGARRDGLWWAPESTLWARSRGAREFSLGVERALASKAARVPEAAPCLRVLLPGDRRSAKERLGVYWDHFPRLLGVDVSLMDGTLELLVVPDVIVCALFHFHLAHQPIGIPMGFVSTRQDHIQTSAALLSGKVLGKPDALTPVREEEGGEAVKDVRALLERWKGQSAAMLPTLHGRPRIGLKKPVA